MRRLSSKTKEQPPSAGTSGVENQGFQRDAPNSPWRYPFRRGHPPTGQHQTLHRTISQDSMSSLSSTAIPSIKKQKIALSRIIP